MSVDDRNSLHLLACLMSKGETFAQKVKSQLLLLLLFFFFLFFAGRIEKENVAFYALPRLKLICCFSRGARVYVFVCQSSQLRFLCRHYYVESYFCVHELHLCALRFPSVRQEWETEKRNAYVKQRNHQLKKKRVRERMEKGRECVKAVE